MTWIVPRWCHRVPMTVIVFGCLLYSACVHSKELFLPIEGSFAAGAVQTVLPGVRVIANQPALADVAQGSTLSFSIPGGKSYNVIVDRVASHEGGNITLIGHVDGQDTRYRAVISFGGGRATGHLQTPDGKFLIENRADGVWLVPESESSRRPVRNPVADGLPPPANLKSQSRSAAPLLAAATLGASGESYVDLLVYYTPGFSTANAGNPRLRLDYLVSLSNQAYIDSGIPLVLRMVGMIQVNYADTKDQYSALYDLSDQSDVFAGVVSDRVNYGADLVTLIRPFSDSHSGICGLAWMPTTQSGFYKELGYSSVSDGALANGDYCDDSTLAHELGHNFGQNHDREHSSGDGYHSYSYGYGRDGYFGDIMSYYWPKALKFSSPNLYCLGYVCGSAAGNANAADSARSMSLTRSYVSAYYPSRQVASFVPEKGWWWDSSKSGSGYAIEINNGSVFVGVFMYASNGRPVWYASSGALSGTTYSGDLLYYRGGQTFTGGYIPPSSSSVIGKINIYFLDSKNAILSLPNGFVANISRFNIVDGGAASPSSSLNNINGWYWNASESGRGFYFETQKDTVFGAGFMYDAAGEPVWYALNNKWSTVDSCYAGVTVGGWLEYSGGQYLGGTYKAPYVSNGSVLPAYAWFDRCNDKVTVYKDVNSSQYIDLSKFPVNFK